MKNMVLLYQSEYLPYRFIPAKQRPKRSADPISRPLGGLAKGKLVYAP